MRFFMLDILYQDNHLLCLDKPGGLLTQPSGTGLESLESQGKAWLKQEFHKPGAVFLEAVHRIDRPVCGVVLFARTSKALARLNASIRAGECVKEYHALVENAPRHESGTLRDWLLHDSHCARVVPAGTPESREATLTWRMLEHRKDGTALLHILLETGRYHQIRAQLAHAAMPILGDRKYGSTQPYRQECIALQHYRLTILHPITRAQMFFTSRQPL